MRRPRLRMLWLLGVLLAVTSEALTPQPAGEPLARLMPAGALLYLESQDFAKIVHDWNQSPEKASWLASDNYRVFSRSRLFLRLQEVQREFAEAAGAPLRMQLLESVAGGRSALALYDIGNLEFLYITRLSAPRALDNALWRGKGTFEPRKVADSPYYIRNEAGHKRVVAFAVSNDYFLVATREDLIAGALSVLAGTAMHTVADEAWYASAAGAAGPPGEVRLVLNLERLTRSPHFRSYWIQRNVSSLRQYGVEVADVHRSAREIREERLLLRAPASVGGPDRGLADQTAIARLLRLVPETAGVYRAWAAPSSEQVVSLLQQKVLVPEVGRAAVSMLAPEVALSEAQAGTEGDLETRIDAPPFAAAGDVFQPEALKDLIARAGLTGVLQVESTRRLAGNDLVGTQSAIVAEAANDWNSDNARAALAKAVEGVWTTSGIGIGWVERGAGVTGYFELDGLSRVAMAVRGRLLIVGTSRDPVLAVLNHLPDRPGEQTGVYAGGFRHGAEREDLMKMTRLIETPLAQPVQLPDGREPRFFSENLASLSQSLARVDSESILIRDRGAAVAETVTYHLTK
jgi:hypothetical protein